MRFRGLFTGSGPTLQEWLQDFTGNHVSGDSVCTGHIESHQSATAVEHRSTTQVGLQDRVVLDGFMEVVSGPLVRSSYRADRVFDKNNAGLEQTA